MRLKLSSLLAFCLFAACAAYAQDPPKASPQKPHCLSCGSKEIAASTPTVKSGPLPAFFCSQCGGRKIEIPPGLGQGVSPEDTLYNLMLSLVGKEKTEEFIQKGFKNLEKNLYRNYYIEKGYFLLPTRFPSDPFGKELDHLIVIPKDPGSEPMVIFMKEAHRQASNAAGVVESIREAVKKGDTDLIYLAGKNLFDSRFTQDDFTFNVAEGIFDKKIYYYKIDQKNFFSKWKLEGGLGGSLKLGKAPYYLGGSVGVKGELDAAWSSLIRSKGIETEVQPLMKAGFWGKMPFWENTSFGLSAIQTFNWNTDKGESVQFFSTEFRGGIFHQSDGAAFGALLYHRRTGEDFFSSDSRANGIQLSYSPPAEPVALAFSYERSDPAAWGDDKSKPDHRFLLALELLKKKEADLDAAAKQLLGEDASAQDLAGLYKLAYEGLRYLGGLDPNHNRDEKITPRGLLEFLRSKLVDPMPSWAMVLSSGAVMAAPPESILKTAYAIEAGNFKPNDDSPIPGWTPWPGRAQSGVEAAEAAIKEAGFEASPERVKMMEKLVLIYAPALRRHLDYKAMRALLLLSYMTEQVSQGISLRSGSVSAWEGADSWKLLNQMNRDRRREIKNHLETAAQWLKQDFSREGKKMQAQFVRYGRDLLESVHQSQDWPKRIKIKVKDSSWPSILAGYGEDFFVLLLNRIKEKASDGKPIEVEVVHVSLPGSLRMRKMGPSQFYVELLDRQKGFSKADSLKLAFDYLDRIFP